MLAAGAVALLALGGGIAYAATSSSSPGGPVAACAGKVTGLLRLDTGRGCLPSEDAVQLGGPPHVDEWSRYGGTPVANGVWPDVRGHETVVQTFHLDPGQYLVSAEILAINESGQGVLVCQVGNSTLGITLAQAAVGTAAGFAQQQTMQEQTVFDVPTPQDLVLGCFNAPPNEPAGDPLVNDYDITATRIGSSTFDGAPNP